MSKSKFTPISIIIIAFAVLWFLVVGIDFGNKHPYYYNSFTFFRYFGTSIFFLGSMFLSFGLLFLLKKNDAFIPFVGLVSMLLTAIYLFVIVYVNKDHGFMPTKFSNVLAFYGFSLKTAASLILLTMIMKSIGHFIYTKLIGTSDSHSFAVDTALGIMVFTTILFFLGVFNVLNATSVLLTIFLFLVINITNFFNSLKDLLFTSIHSSKISYLGLGAFVFILFFLSINLLSIHIPYPVGFDSRNFYVNISQLLAVENSLIEGFQPYNWSLFMSIGLLLFDHIEVTLGISFLAIILSLSAGFEFATKELKIDYNKSFFACALFAVTPAVVNQMHVELKVDFGLLFFQIATLYAFFKYLKYHKSSDGESSKDANKNSLKFLVLIGLLCGFGLGIKLINMFLVFSIAALIWWDSKNLLSLAGVLCISLSVLVLLGIDELSGLQVYHLSLNYASLGALIIGIALFIAGFLSDKSGSIRKITSTLIIAVSAFLMLSPWIVKNYAETRSLSPKKLLLGKTVGPDVNSSKLVGNYVRAYNKIQQQKKQEGNK